MLERGDLVWVSFNNPKDTATLGAAVIGFLAAAPRQENALLVYVLRTAFAGGEVKVGQAHIFEKRTVFKFNHLAEESGIDTSKPTGMFGVRTHGDLHTTLRLARNARRNSRSSGVEVPKNRDVYVDVASVHEAREDWLRRVEDANKNKNLFAFFAGAGAGYAEFMSSPVYFNSGVSLILWRERTLWASRENANNRLLHRQLERMWTSSGGGLIGKQQQTVKLSDSFFAAFHTLMPAQMANAFVQQMVAQHRDHLFVSRAFGILPPAHLLLHTGPIIAIFEGGAILTYINENPQEVNYVNIADGVNSSTFIEAVLNLHSQKRVISSNIEASSSSLPYITSWLLFWESGDPPTIGSHIYGEEGIATRNDEHSSERVWVKSASIAGDRSRFDFNTLTLGISKVMVQRFFTNRENGYSEMETLPFMPYPTKEVGSSLFKLFYPDMRLNGSDYVDSDTLSGGDSTELAFEVVKWLGFQKPREALEILSEVWSIADSDQQDATHDEEDVEQSPPSFWSLFKSALRKTMGDYRSDDEKEKDDEELTVLTDFDDEDTGSEGAVGVDNSSPLHVALSQTKLPGRIRLWEELVVVAARQLYETSLFVYKDNAKPTINSLMTLLTNKALHSNYQYVLRAMSTGSVGKLSEEFVLDPLATVQQYLAWAQNFSSLLMLLRGMESLLEFATLTSMDTMIFTSESAYRESYGFWFNGGKPAAPQQNDTWQFYFKHALSVRSTLIPLPFPAAAAATAGTPPFEILSVYAPLVRITKKLRQLSQAGHSPYRTSRIFGTDDSYRRALLEAQESLLESTTLSEFGGSFQVKPMSTPVQSDDGDYSQTEDTSDDELRHSILGGGGESPPGDTEVDKTVKQLQSMTFGEQMRIEFSRIQHQRHLDQLIGAPQLLSGTPPASGAATRRVGIQRVQLQDQASHRAESLLKHVKDTRSQETVDPFFTSMSQRRLQFYDEVLLKNQLVTTQLESPSLPIIKRVESPLLLMRLFNGLQRRALTCAMFAELCDDVSIFYDNADSGRQQSFAARTLVESIDFRRRSHMWGSALFTKELGFRCTYHSDVDLSTPTGLESFRKLLSINAEKLPVLILLPEEKSYIVQLLDDGKLLILRTPWGTYSYSAEVLTEESSKNASVSVTVISRSAEYLKAEIIEFARPIKSSSQYLFISEKDLASKLTLGQWWYNYGGAAAADLFRRPTVQRENILSLTLLDRKGKNAQKKADYSLMRELSSEQISKYILQSLFYAGEYIENAKENYKVESQKTFLNKVFAAAYATSLKFRSIIRTDANDSVPSKAVVKLSLMTDPIYEREFVYLICGYMHAGDTPKLYVLMNRSNTDFLRSRDVDDDDDDDESVENKLSLFAIEHPTTASVVQPSDPTARDKPFEGKVRHWIVREENAQRLLSSAVFVLGYSPYSEPAIESTSELKQRLKSIQEDCEARGKALTVGLSAESRVFDEALTLVKTSVDDYSGSMLTAVLFFRDGCKRTFYDEQRFRIINDGFEFSYAALEHIIDITPRGHYLITKTVQPWMDPGEFKEVISSRQRGLLVYLGRSPFHFSAYQRISETLYAVLTSEKTVTFCDSPDQVALALVSGWEHSAKSFKMLCDVRNYKHTLLCINTARSYIYSGRAADIRIGELLELVSYKAAIHYRAPPNSAQQLWMMDSPDSTTTTSSAINEVSLLLVDRKQNGLLLMRRIHTDLFVECVDSAEEERLVLSAQDLTENYLSTYSYISWA